MSTDIQIEQPVTTSGQAPEKRRRTMSDKAIRNLFIWPTLILLIVINIFPWLRQVCPFSSGCIEPLSQLNPRQLEALFEENATYREQRELQQKIKAKHKTKQAARLREEQELTAIGKEADEEEGGEEA